MRITESDFKRIQRVRSGGNASTVSERKSGIRVKTGIVHPAATDTLIAQAGKHSSPSLYRSKWEAAFAHKLEMEKRVGLIKQFWYEPFSLWLPGNVRYKPDFLIEQRLPVDDTDRRILELVEVKGWSRNRRDGITRLKMAAALFPCFVWRMVYMKKGGGWDGEYV